MKKKSIIKHEPGIDFPIIGIGASAGGLEALEKFFSKMPPDTGAAFIVIQHLSPDHKTNMDAILHRYTGMDVLKVEDGMKIEQNHVYVNPPNRLVGVFGRSFQLLLPEASEPKTLTIDYFFHSLAEDQRERAIAVILSGTGMDGSQGIKSIKAHGGMTIAQEKEQAKYSGMPASAIETGLIDTVLKVENMAEEIIRYTAHPYYHPGKKTVSDIELKTRVQKVLYLIMKRTGHDFSNYKPTTILRRIEKRMALHHIERTEDYVRFIQNDNSEADILFKEMLIGVTGFFREPDAFVFLSEKIIPDLINQAQPSTPLRVWVAGCATGEEAFSLAILIVEAMEALQKHVPVQIFASDLDPIAVEFARKATYPESIADSVKPERLKRFFLKHEGSYRLKKQIRDMIVFAVHNIIKDPPFSKLDLLSCRNLLIYLDSAAQNKLIPLFYFTLKEDGVLLLGPSENIGEHVDLFAPVNAKLKIFTRKKGASYNTALLKRIDSIGAIEQKFPVEPKKAWDSSEIHGIVERMVLESYAPPGIIINEAFDILYFIGKTDPYLTPPNGEPNYSILGMVREELRYRLTPVLHRAVSQKKSARIENISFKAEGAPAMQINIAITPLVESIGHQSLFLILFEREQQLKKKGSVKDKASRRGRADLLEHELRAVKEQLQGTIEEFEVSQEEFKSTNEELQSLNEELQSTIEELETSKEEIQSTNEELITVNSELQNKVEELSAVNNDINNLLAGTEIGTMFLDGGLCIKRFNPEIKKIFNLIPSDIGRPVGDITSNIPYDALQQDARTVLDTLTRKEAELRDRTGNWYKMSILPYRTVENIISGVVVTFVDITKIKMYEIESENARILAESVVDTTTQPLMILDGGLNVVKANRALYAMFNLIPDDIIGKRLYDIGNGTWAIPELRQLIEEIIPKDKKIYQYPVPFEFSSGETKKLFLNACKIDQEEDRPDLILLIIEENVKI
jgi:two-component system, chemotaxis family, CheB/CheR fusion protein